MGPFLFQDGDKHKIELVEECALGFEILFGARALDDEFDNEITDT